jgi:PHD/YefM family antitoxin component YafN of YafNO toxin-antitoxin module
MKTTVSASRARQELFRLMEQVTESEGRDRVVIQRRGSPEGVALVRESYVRYLEARVEAAEAAAPKEPFKLAGSLTVHGDVEEMLRDSREAQTKLREARFRDIYG